MNYQLHPAIKKHLVNIGLAGEGNIESFLFPALAELPSPNLLKSIEPAVDLVIQAISDSHDILIWGDYDVDGITGASLLVLFFQAIGVEPKCHIPDRLTEGYGLNRKRLIEIASSMSPAKLLITVDCGISNSSEITHAQELGFKVIVTDHHQVPDGKLCADATINPKQDGCQFPFKDLAGVGVSFYFAAAIRARLKINNDVITGLYDINMMSFMGMVSLGTLADIMPLSGVNRILAKAGFEAIAKSNDSTVTALLRGLDLDPTRLNSEQVAFQVAPVINAAGRMGRADLPFTMLTSRSSERVDKIVTEMIALNKERKRISRKDLEQAQSLLSAAEIEQDKCIVICNDFHDGILGITASRLTDIFSVPALVCSLHPTDNSLIKGSGRAPAGFNLYKSLFECRHLLNSFGGHEAAAGFSLDRGLFNEFQRKFAFSVQTNIENNYSESSILESKYVELTLSEALDPMLLSNLVQLEPFGEGNPRPIFFDSEVKFVSLSYFGKTKEHVRGMVRTTYRNMPFIGFNLGNKFSELDSNYDCTMSYTHMLDRYNGKSSWKIRANNVWQKSQVLS